MLTDPKQGKQSGVVEVPVCKKREQAKGWTVSSWAERGQGASTSH